MADAYRAARSSGKEVVWLNERPYLPNLHVVDDEESVVACVERIFGLLGTTSRLLTDRIVTRVQGGATNRLYRVGDVVLVRIFGAEGMIDRDEETAIYAQLATISGLAPPYYGRFANGRVEGWMKNMRTLTTPELPNYARSIAAQMRKLHDSTEAVLGSSSGNDLQPGLWDQLYTWLEQAESQQQVHHGEESLTDLVGRVRPELTWLKSLASNYACRVGFCHNDVLAANVLVSDADEMVQLIDFEYGGINYFAFDVANHWNEYAGCPPTCTDPDYNLLPNAQVRRSFLESYASKDLDEKEVDYFLLVNHLYWGLWAVNQSATEGNDAYNYARYAKNRISQYFMDKTEQEAAFSAHGAGEVLSCT